MFLFFAYLLSTEHVSGKLSPHFDAGRGISIFLFRITLLQELREVAYRKRVVFSQQSVFGFCLYHEAIA